MGIVRGIVNILLREAARLPFSGSVLTLGRQDVFVDGRCLGELAHEAGVSLAAAVPEELSAKPELAAAGFISDVCLLQRLGFSEVVAVDVSDYEGAGVIFDLNHRDPPAELEARFDVVVESGTLEHVFHIPNVLRNISFFLRPGGRVIHLSPASNHVDHGLYMFSPTLFWSYYSSNGFTIDTLQLIRHTRRPQQDPWLGRDYSPGSLDHISFGGLDDHMYSVLCVATKPESGATCEVPQQHFYEHEGWTRAPSSPAAQPRGWRRVVRDRLPAAYGLGKSIRDRVRLWWHEKRRPGLHWPYRY